MINLGVVVASALFFAFQPPQEIRYCPLQILVQKWNGSPLARVAVTALPLVQDHGEYQSAISDHKGIAALCDIDPGLYDVHIGSSACNQVVVRNVSIESDEPIKLTVIYQPCPDFMFRAPGCPVFLRLRDRDGKAVPDAAVGEGSSILMGTRFDSNGRLIASTGPGAGKKVVVAAPGFKPAELELSCPQRGSVLIRTLVLERLP